MYKEKFELIFLLFYFLSLRIHFKIFKVETKFQYL